VVSKYQQHHDCKEEYDEEHYSISTEKRLPWPSHAVGATFLFVYHVLTSSLLPMSATGVDCAMKAEVSRFGCSKTAKKCCWVISEVLDSKR
jgi:hypothetical protein